MGQKDELRADDGRRARRDQASEPSHREIMYPFDEMTYRTQDPLPAAPHHELAVPGEPTTAWQEQFDALIGNGIPNGGWGEWPNPLTYLDDAIDQDGPDVSQSDHVQVPGTHPTQAPTLDLLNTNMSPTESVSVFRESTVETVASPQGKASPRRKRKGDPKKDQAAQVNCRKKKIKASNMMCDEYNRLPADYKALVEARVAALEQAEFKGKGNSALHQADALAHASIIAKDMRCLLQNGPSRMQELQIISAVEKARSLHQQRADAQPAMTPRTEVGPSTSIQPRIQEGSSSNHYPYSF